MCKSFCIQHHCDYVSISLCFAPLKTNLLLILTAGFYEKFKPPACGLLPSTSVCMHSPAGHRGLRVSHEGDSVLHSVAQATIKGTMPFIGNSLPVFSEYIGFHWEKGVDRISMPLSEAHCNLQGLPLLILMPNRQSHRLRPREQRISPSSPPKRK